MNILKITILTLFLISLGCIEKSPTTSEKSSNSSKKGNGASGKIPVLNLGTFHFGYTTDANTTEFDEHSLENQKQAHRIAEKLSAFKPTVILVEHVPAYNGKLLKEYEAYLANPNMHFENPSEVELLAFELGRLSGVKRIYGIDHKMGYNYNIGNEIKNDVDPTWYSNYYMDPLSFYPEVDVDEDDLDLLGKLKLTNHNRYLDFLITVNADMLTHAGSEEGFEGADEATKFYKRNLRMYTNLNRIELNENDRVFILMGASHAAFFRDFISRSPKYEMVNTFDYLK